MSDEREPAIPRGVREAILSRLTEYPFPLVVATEFNLRPGELRADMSDDPDFAKEVEHSVSVGRERLTATAYDRAMTGSTEVVTDADGEVIRTVHKTDNQLLSTLMRSLDPNMRTEQTVVHRIELSPDERQKRLAAMVMTLKSQALLESQGQPDTIDAEFDERADHDDRDGDGYDYDDLAGLA